MKKKDFNGHRSVTVIRPGDVVEIKPGAKLINRITKAPVKVDSTYRGMVLFKKDGKFAVRLAKDLSFTSSLDGLLSSHCGVLLGEDDLELDNNL